MNPSELQGDLLQPKPPEPAPPSEEIQLWSQIYRLQTILAVTLVALIFLSLGLILFVGKQMTAVRARLDAERQQAEQIYVDFRKTRAPLIYSFVRHLQVFAATNQDFAPILEKYRPALSAYFAPASPAAAPDALPTNTLPPPGKADP